MYPELNAFELDDYAATYDATALFEQYDEESPAQRAAANDEMYDNLYPTLA